MFHEHAHPPKETSQQCTASTHTEAVHHQGVLLKVFHLCLWPLKSSRWHPKGRVAKLLVGAL